MKTSLLHLLFIFCLGAQIGHAANGVQANLISAGLTVPQTFGGPRLKLENTVFFNDDLPFDTGQFVIVNTFTNINFSFVSPEQDGNIHLDFILTLQNTQSASGTPFIYDVDLVSIELLNKSEVAGVLTDTLDFHTIGNVETTHYFNTLTNVGAPPEKLTWSDGLMAAQNPPKDTVFSTQVRLDLAENFPTNDSFDFRYRVTIHTVPEPSSIALLLGGAAFCLRRRSLRQNDRNA